MEPNLPHGGDVTGYRLQFGGEPLDFSSNLNPFGLPEGVKQAAIEALEQSATYPDPLCRALREAISAKERLPAAHILCGNGAADLIYRLVLALRPKKALLPVPAFSEYEEALRVTGCDIIFYPMTAEKNFALSEDILRHITPDIELIFLCNPNNPTGHVIAPSLLEQILLQCAQTGTKLVVDECFNAFLSAPETHTLRPYLEQYQNLIILKAFTKTYAMAGLRLGYLLCSDEELLTRIAASGQPWPVSNVAQAAGIAALKEDAYLAHSMALLQEENRFLREGLTRLGYHVIGFQANYIFFRAAREDLPEALRTRGILIRGCENYRGLNRHYCRIAVRLRNDNIPLLAALEEIDSFVM